ncbi:MAG: alkaline phosphatase [Sphingomonas sp.]|nr:alkaline phosphatase [Sphingomonas sp.]
MTIRIDRRSLLMTGTLGAGALAIPGFAQTPAISAARGFTHAVASGEPMSDSMLLWTRYVPETGDSAELRVEMSTTADFAKIMGGGVQVTGPWRDWTSKITVGGLRAGTVYHYRFIAPDGSKSPVGRTKTLPEGAVKSFKAGIFSCSNLPFGYFNAYAHAAAQGDLDLAIHLGDYMYEYAIGNYPALEDTVAGRVIEPATEMVRLADYRLRFASYRADPDLQKLHQLVPMIMQWDDHESTNDSWEGGAQNHQNDEGDWNVRRAASIQAYREWMPISDEPWKAYDIGTLATLFRTETRLIGRTKQPDIAPLFRNLNVIKALTEFRDGAWQNPSMTMMGSQQEEWLAHGIRQSVKAGQQWQVVGFGTIMGTTMVPEAAAGWLAPDAPPRTRNYVMAGIAASKAGLPSNFDSWGGYPAARARFLKGAQAAGANLVVISGDSHNGWAYDLAQDGKAAGVEFAGQGVTSPGYESAIKVDPKQVAAALVAASPELKWCDTSRRGYMTLTITPERVTNDWIFVDTIKAKSMATTIGHTATVTRGRNLMG